MKMHESENFCCDEWGESCWSLHRNHLHRHRDLELSPPSFLVARLIVDSCNSAKDRNSSLKLWVVNSRFVFPTITLFKNRTWYRHSLDSLISQKQAFGLRYKPCLFLKNRIVAMLIIKKVGRGIGPLHVIFLVQKGYINKTPTRVGVQVSIINTNLKGLFIQPKFTAYGCMHHKIYHVGDFYFGALRLKVSLKSHHYILLNTCARF